MADDIKRFEPPNIPVDIILAHLKHIPAAMTDRLDFEFFGITLVAHGTS